MKLRTNVTRTKIRPQGKPLKPWIPKRKDCQALKDTCLMIIRMGMLGAIATSLNLLMPLLVRADSLDLLGNKPKNT